MNSPQSKNIFEWIDSPFFRKRPALYLGEKSISKLKLFMTGYATCEQFNHIQSVDTKPPFRFFFDWIVNYYEHSGSYFNWDGIILQNCKMEEDKALDVFLTVLMNLELFNPKKYQRQKSIKPLGNML